MWGFFFLFRVIPQQLVATPSTSRATPTPARPRNNHPTSRRTAQNRRDNPQAYIPADTLSGIAHAFNVPTAEPVDEEEAELPQWGQIVRGANQNNLTYGRRQMSFVRDLSVVVNSLKQIYSSITSRPDDKQMSDTPVGLLVDLMPHQKHALTFMNWRETQQPPGGILADEMGLGKTISLISLFQHHENNLLSYDIVKPARYQTIGANLVVCPLAVIRQWESECGRAERLSVFVHHGPNKAKNYTRLAKYDVVITTYDTLTYENRPGGPTFEIYWTRIVLDEGHLVRNKDTIRADAVLNLAGKYKWVVSGTPIHNREDDLFPVFSFLNLSPFNEFNVFSKWLKGDGSARERLHVLMRALMLRRTKKTLIQQGVLQLPDKVTKFIDYQMDDRETEVHNMLLLYSQALFRQFLGNKNNTNLRQATQEEDEIMKRIQSRMSAKDASKVQANNIFVMLIRLRQVCCHPLLIKCVSFY